MNDRRLIAAALIAWLRLITLNGEPARVEPKTLRHRLFGAATRPGGSERRRLLKIAAIWPWATAITTAWQPLCAPASPVTVGSNIPVTRKDPSESRSLATGPPVGEVSGDLVRRRARSSSGKQRVHPPQQSRQFSNCTMPRMGAAF
jgi:hypothetical protein